MSRLLTKEDTCNFSLSKQIYVFPYYVQTLRQGTRFSCTVHSSSNLCLGLKNWIIQLSVVVDQVNARCTRNITYNNLILVFLELSTPLHCRYM